MFKNLKPDFYVEHLRDIPLKKLKERGIKGLIIDLDNTITEWNSNQLNQEVINWFETIKGLTFGVCLVSNNNFDRVQEVANQLELPFVSSARKPFRRAFSKAMAILETKPDETAVIGDQIFTDVLGGNRSNLTTILVMPLDSNEFIGTRLMRQLERLFIGKIEKYEPQN